MSEIVKRLRPSTTHFLLRLVQAGLFIVVFYLGKAGWETVVLFSAAFVMGAISQYLDGARALSLPRE